MELSGQQFDQLEAALIDAYPAPFELKRMGEKVFGRRIFQKIPAGAAHAESVYNLLEWAEKESKFSELIRGAHRFNPSNNELKKFCLALSDALIEEAIAQNFDSNSSLTKASITQLANLILASNSFFEHVAAAGSAALPASAGDVVEDFQEAQLLPVMRLCGLFRLLLAGYPTSHDGEPTLLLFAEGLLKRLGTGVDSAPLQNWIQQVDPSDGTVTSHPSALGTLQVALMVTVQASTQRQGKHPLYFVNGYLYFDQIVGRGAPCVAPKPLVALSLPESMAQLGTECLWSKVGDRIDQFCSEALIQLEQIRKELCCELYELTVELFLPIEKMGESLDQLPKSSSPRDQPMGTDHGVTVRFVDRLLDDPDSLLRRNELRGIWKQLQAKLEPPHSLKTLDGQVESLHAFEHYSSWRQLEGKLKPQLGLKICCGLPAADSERAKLFEAIFYSDTPFAVWTRCDTVIDAESDDANVQLLDISAALMPFLAAEHFRDSMVRTRLLKDLRYQAWVQEAPNKKDRCLGDHLAVLLDNPNRLPILPQLQTSSS